MGFHVLLKLRKDSNNLNSQQMFVETYANLIRKPSRNIVEVLQTRLTNPLDDGQAESHLCTSATCPLPTFERY